MSHATTADPVEKTANTLLSRHLAFIGKAKALGKPTITLTCPSKTCTEQIEKLRPTEPNDVWTSLASCPHCDCLYHYAIRTDGSSKVEIIIP